MTQNKEYYAFISYKREDEKWAKWLQDKLEHYRFPTNLNGRTDLPKSIRPTFRDVTDLKPGLLAEEINNALRNSEWLIVICSPRSAKSPWVCKEAQTFIDLGRADHIIPFVIEGKPFSNDSATECYPEALLDLTGSKELLAANINEMGRDAAAIKVIARMFGLHYDALWQRHEREQRKKRNWIIFAAILAFICISGIAFWMYWQYQQAEKANLRMMESHARTIVEKASTILDDGDSYLAKQLILEVIKNHAVIENQSLIQDIEYVLRKSAGLHGAVFRGHEDVVNSVVVSPDGKYVASASNDCTVIVWETMTGRIVKHLKGHSGNVNSVVFSPDGKHVLSASDDGTVRKWNLDNAEVMILQKHASSAMDMSFSKDGKSVVVVHNDRTVSIWDYFNCKKVKEFSLKNGDIYFSIEFSSDGRNIITASGLDNSIRIFDIQTGKEIKSLLLRDSIDWVNFATFSPDGKQIISGADHDNGIIRTWDLGTWKQCPPLRGHSGNVTSAVFSPDGNFIASASDDGTIILWDAMYGKKIEQFKGHSDNVNSVAYSPNGKFIVSASNDQTVRIWDTKEESKVISNHVICHYATFSADEKNVVSLVNNNTIRVINLEDRKIQEFEVSCLGEVTCVTCSQNGKYLAVESNEGVVLWDIEKRTKINSMQRKHFDLNHSLTLSSNGKYVSSVSWGGSVIVWNAMSGEEIMSYSDEESIKSVTLSPDGNYIASISIGGGVVVRDVMKGEKVWERAVDRVKYNSLAFSADGKYIVSTSDSHLATVWDVKTGNVSLSVKDNNAIKFAAFSPNGKYLLTVSNPIYGSSANYVEKKTAYGLYSISIWNVATGKIVKTYKGHTGNINSAVFSPSGKQIVSASYDGSIRIWDFPPLQELIDQTRERFMNRQLTPEERRKFYLE